MLKIQNLAEASIGVRPTRLAQMMGVSRCYIYRLVQQGRLPRPKRITSNVSLFLTGDLVPALVSMGLLSDSAGQNLLDRCSASTAQALSQVSASPVHDAGLQSSGCNDRPVGIHKVCEQPHCMNDEEIVMPRRGRPPKKR